MYIYSCRNLSGKKVFNYSFFQQHFPKIEFILYMTSYIVFLICLALGVSLGAGYVSVYQCDVSNCQICSSTNFCQLCSNGYNAANGTCLSISQTPCSIQGCAACSTSSTCQTCLTGYSLTPTFQCSLCLYPCATCGSTATYCQTCMIPYSTNAVNGVCYTCNVDNCVQCNQYTPQNCTQCASGYSLKNNTCVYTSVCSKTCTSCASN